MNFFLLLKFISKMKFCCFVVWSCEEQRDESDSNPKSTQKEKQRKNILDKPITKPSITQSYIEDEGRENAQELNKRRVFWF